MLKYVYREGRNAIRDDEVFEMKLKVEVYCNEDLSEHNMVGKRIS